MKYGVGGNAVAFKVANHNTPSLPPPGCNTTNIDSNTHNRSLATVG